jgi:hypothetical protein
MLLQEILKDISFLQLHLCPGHLAGHALAGNGRPVFFFFFSWRLIQNSSLSIQLTRFLLASCYHANPVLQIPHGLCGAHLANPHFVDVPSSLEPRQASV